MSPVDTFDHLCELLASHETAAKAMEDFALGVKHERDNWRQTRWPLYPSDLERLLQVCESARANGAPRQHLFFLLGAVGIMCKASSKQVNLAVERFSILYS